MLRRTAKFATCALVGTLLIGGGAVSVHAENAYETTAVAGVTLSLNDYADSFVDETPVQVTATSSDAKKVSKKNAKFVAANVENSVNIRKSNSKKAEVVGQMYRGDTGKLIKKGKKWSKIKSGHAKGWVRNDFLLFGDEARAFADKICAKTVTVNTTTLNVRKKKSTESDIVTQIPIGGEYGVTKECDDWVKIDIDGDLKGYVSKDYVDINVEYGEALTMKEIAEIEKANALIEAEAAAEGADTAPVDDTQIQTTTVTQTVTQTIKQTTSQSISNIKPTKKKVVNKSSNSSSTGTTFSNNASVSSSSSSDNGGYSSKGQEIANYACKFVGNPYVYGGTSLTHGTDCSGFTMSVYAHFGYSIARTAAAQSNCGKAVNVSLSSLRPGDLLFYNNGGGIGHVAMYIGNGTVVHASNAKDGIKYSVWNYRTPCKARRIV